MKLLVIPIQFCPWGNGIVLHSKRPFAIHIPCAPVRNPSFHPHKLLTATISEMAGAKPPDLSTQNAPCTSSSVQPKRAAHGRCSTDANKSRIFLLTQEQAHHFGVRIYRFSNVGNHLHLLVLFRLRKGFQNFLRSITGAIAFLVTGTRKGKELKRRFLDPLAFTRVVSWGREFRVVSIYFVKNLLESLEFLAPGMC